MSGAGGTSGPGHVFVIAAPSGTGKTTVCRRILALDPQLRLSVSHTTRAPRAAERDGVDYHFVDDRRFRQLVDREAFLEHAEYGGHAYGTSWQAIEAPLAAGEDVVLEIEVQGAAQVRERLPAACLIFLLPPDLEVLERRLRARGTDTEAVIQKRMALVDRELAAAGIFDYAIVNDDLDRSVEDVLAVIRGVRAGRTEGLARRYGRREVLARWEQARSNSGDRVARVTSGEYDPEVSC